ncbi:lipoprotein insertase outer membrane protein LolB [Janthinobacterium sp. 17J80-10]|uniref:lipoprotein insertase outer membrane protein LolB n=1 Tax=Janthinobacterium sp. 17J80-10 TaxID=2497863 RepID=UPI001005A662|nr:lipoprotein insertase outer membrane protein LolB [Janthinobacterium sp. 17J80-10]QAU33385.1 outer membrane lipoprotein LolB [Janthinobacterium sp. 17J80-10]
MNRRLACAAALGWLLAGCAALSPPPDAASVTGAQLQRPYAEAIELAGRLSVQYRRGNTDEALHGSFSWSQTPQRTLVTLLSPLGQTLAVIEVQPGSATLTQAGQPPQAAPDADALAQTALGWPLPVAGLRTWLQGFAQDARGQRWIAPPASGSTVTTPDGWHIVYASWQQDNRDATARPRRIDLARQTQEAGPVSLRIVIDHWQAN